MQKNTFGETAFMTAVRYNLSGIAQLLKDAGANVGAKDKDGRNALDWARSVGHRGMIEYLENGVVSRRYVDGSSVSEGGELLKPIQKSSDLHRKELREVLEGSKKLVGRIVG